MPKHIICTLPHASHNISGIPFQDHLIDGKIAGVITKAPVADRDAERFGSIPGYKLVDVDDEGEPKPSVPVAGAKRGRKPRQEAAPDAAADADKGEGANGANPGGDAGSEG